MNKYTFLSLSVAGAVAFLAFTAAPKPVASQPASVAPTQAELVTLADACRITQLMNEDKWDEVTEALGTREGMVVTLRQLASAENWPGIGAFRGTRIKAQSPLQVTHRFGFVPRSNSHEIWLTYTITEKAISKPGLLVFGW